MRLKLFPWIVLAVALVAFTASTSDRAEAAGFRVECGVVLAYVAPNSQTHTPGSIAFGFTGTPIPIDPNAFIPAAVGTFLTQVQGAPTCLGVASRRDGSIVALSFVARGTICGKVVYDANSQLYITAGRIGTPASSLATNLVLNAILGSAAEGDATICLTLNIDVATGLPVAFSGQFTLSGLVTEDAETIYVGKGGAPKSLLGPRDVAVLEFAQGWGLPVALTVTGHGTIDTNTGDVVATVAYRPQVPTFFY